jgi:ribosome modulation factor
LQKIVSNGLGLAVWTDMETAPQLRGRSGPWIGGWHLGPQDRFTVADLDGDGRDELFVRSSLWAGVLRWRAETGDFACDWISGDPAANANWIDGWHLGPLSREIAVDIDGSGRRALFVRSSRWAGLFRLTNASMTCPWMTGDPGANRDWIGGWHLGLQDRAAAGNFRVAGAEELFIRSPQWAGLLAWTGDGLETVWMSGDPAANANWVDGWHLGPQDREAVGRFTGELDQVLVRSRRWAGVFGWEPRSGEHGVSLDDR